MQPYFLPYAGYMRLFLDVDVFVALDNVQYQKGGWINRNKLRTPSGEYDWLAVPFRKGPLHMQISDLAFRDDAGSEMAKRMARFPACVEPNAQAAPIVEAARNTIGSGCDYLIELLSLTNEALGIATPIIKAQSIPLDASLRGADRVLAILEALNAKVYYNASGGVELYDSDDFAARGIELRFHPPYRGNTASILQRLQDDDAGSVLGEMRENLV
ncbi:MAG: hypothetical protein QOJ91_2018 [Sphingomonadales bacterium]|jgi:hypothetical protein|nr:hypothetical protein [Sphingomonadales bacterium]